jgi:hypothetical protein
MTSRVPQYPIWSVTESFVSSATSPVIDWSVGRPPRWVARIATAAILTAGRTTDVQPTEYRRKGAAQIVDRPPTT